MQRLQICSMSTMVVCVVRRAHCALHLHLCSFVPLRPADDAYRGVSIEPFCGTNGGDSHVVCRSGAKQKVVVAAVACQFVLEAANVGLRLWGEPKIIDAKPRSESRTRSFDAKPRLEARTRSFDATPFWRYDPQITGQHDLKGEYTVYT